MKEHRDPENEIIIVKVGERSFRTALDKHGVQRFLPHDETPADMLALMRDWDTWTMRSMGVGRAPDDIYTPNDLAMDYYNGKFSQDEMLSYETHAGYSVCGLADLSYFEDLDIINPFWEEQR